MYCITAYQPISFILTSGCSLDIYTPGIYMLREEGGNCNIWCTDPTQDRDIINLKFNSKEVVIPLTGRKGQTININL